MTTWQDEAPMSRRALRDRERAESQAAGAADVTSPGSFATASPPPTAPPTPVAPPQQTGPTPGYRVRDYSPDARGTQFSTVGGFPPGGAESARPATPAAAPAMPAEPPRAAAPVAPPVSPAAADVAERVMSRRELRELREAAERAANPEPQAPEPPQQAASFSAPPAVAPAAPQAPPELIEPREPRLQEFAAPQPHYPSQQQSPQQSPQQFPQQPQQYVQQPQQPQYQQQAPQPQQHPVQAQPLFAAPTPDWRAREPEPAPDVVVVNPAAYAPPAPEFELAPDYPAPVAQSAVAAAPTAPPPQPQASVAQAAAQAPGFARPEGHWSRQADLDARTQRDDVLPSRDLSQSDAITTSALVLPSMPSYPIGALSSTGEILVTGSIELPRMLGATGVHPARFDHAEFDSIIEAGDREDSHPSSAPVRAIRAVSTHTSTQGIIAAKRPRSKVPIYLLAGVATIMGVGVVVLFVGGMLLDLF